MKKKTLIIAVLVAAVFFGCKKDKPAEDKVVALNNTPYAAETVPQTKANVESAGVDAVDEMKGLDAEVGTEAAVNLIDLLSGSSTSSTSLIGTLKALKSYQETKNVKTILGSLRNTASDPVSIVKEFDKVKGVYEYNFIKDKFDSVASSTNIIFKFPASKAAKTNKQLTGILTINKPTVKTGPFTYSDQKVDELPTSFGFDIKVNNVTGLSYQFTGAYDDKGIPSAITSTLTIGTFEFKAALNYATSASDVNFSIKHGTKTIVDIGAGVNGNFDKTNIENAYHNEYDTSYYYDYLKQKMVARIDTNKVVDPEKILYNANAHFQLMNIKISGQVDFKDLYTKMQDLDQKQQDGIITEDDANNQAMVLLNKDAALIVVYADDNKMIAKAEAYLNDVIEYDYILRKNVSHKQLDFHMVFADKSKNSLNDYFKDGFSDLFDEINTFITDLNTKYGWSIDPVKKPTK